MINFTKERKKQLIDNAARMMTNAKSAWGTKFWFKVWKTLCIKFGRIN